MTVTIEAVGTAINLFGVAIIIAGVVISIVRSLNSLNRMSSRKIYQQFRRDLGRVILLGLEILIAGDIVRSVAGSLDLSSVGILALIVLIRSFLSITMEMEIEGHWPWQKSSKKSGST